MEQHVICEARKKSVPAVAVQTFGKACVKLTFWHLRMQSNQSLISRFRIETPLVIFSVLLYNMMWGQKSK